MQKLLERVENATGPDREIDGEIALWIGWTHEKLKAARAEKLEARRRAKAAAAKKAAKARPSTPFVPRLVAANEN